MTTTCYSTPCPHLTRDSIDNPILLVALDAYDAFDRAYLAANPDLTAASPINLFDHYMLAATIAADCDFALQRCMIANIDLDDELHRIALIIHYDDLDDADSIRHIMIESDTNLQMIINRDNPDFDPLA